MSRENVEAVRSGWRAFNRGDIEGALSFFADDAEYEIAREHPEYRTCHGVAEIREYLEEWQNELDDMRFEIAEVRENGDDAVVWGSFRGVGKGSGVEVEIPLAYLASFKNGKVVRCAEYLDPRKALEAAGLSE